MGEEEGEEEEKEEEGVGRRKGGGKKRKGKKKVKKNKLEGCAESQGRPQTLRQRQPRCPRRGPGPESSKGEGGGRVGVGGLRGGGCSARLPPPNPAAPAVRADALRSAPLCPTAVLTELAPIPPIHWGVGLAG